MIKYLLIVFNSFILFLFGIFNADNGITVTSKIPASMVVGREVAVELTVTKGAMSGFAKLQMELPEGFTVKEAEEKGATYTFNAGIAKWVWAVLPTENEFTIKLTLVPLAESIGLRTIIAKYSYVENNVKQVVEMTPAEVKVLAEGDAGAESAIAAEAKPEPIAPAAPEKTPESPVLPAQVTSNIESPGSIQLKRSIARVSATEYEVQIRIFKGATKGFARYSDGLPQDVVVKSGKTDGSSYSIADGKIKFVWVNVPEKDTLLVSYIISSKRIQAIELKGEYTYLEDNQSKKEEIEIQSLAFETPLGGEKVIESPADVMVASPSKKQKTPKKSPETKPVIAEAGQKPAAESKKGKTAETSSLTPEAEQKTAAAPKKEKTSSKKAPETKSVKAEPAPKLATGSKKEKGKSKDKSPAVNEIEASAATMVYEDGMIYQVQIGAFTKRAVTTDKLEKRFNLTEPINSEMTGGFTKFMVGSFKEYLGARDHREKIITENKIKSSFVVAYNNGKRITVQEALSITNQKWYK